MTRAAEASINARFEMVSKTTGYSVQFLWEKYSEADGDLEFVIGVSMERDW